MKLRIIVALLFGFSSLGFSQINKQRVVVPDSKTAVKIAEAIAFPIYGKKIYLERPFNTQLQGDSLWIVTGNLHNPQKRGKELYVGFGGVLYIEIRKSDCKIIKVTHGK
jgi:hypothetical protein